MNMKNLSSVNLTHLDFEIRDEDMEIANFRDIDFFIDLKLFSYEEWYMRYLKFTNLKLFT